MKKMLFLTVVLVLLIMPRFSLSALDWGLFLEQNAYIVSAGAVSDTFSDDFTYAGTLVPWLSAPLGSTGKLYLSAGLLAEYLNGKTNFIPQLFRTEVSFAAGQGGEIRAGRMLYSDPLGFVASGLFDGARYSVSAGNKGVLGLGVWYTGLLYKGKAEIMMTGDDLVSYAAPFDYSNFADSYFASRRLVAAVDWDSSYITEWLRLKMALMAQFDLNGNDTRYNSQYFIISAAIPKNSFVFNLGASIETAEISNGSNEFRLGLAGELGIGWMLPTAIPDRLGFTGRFTSGTSGDTMTAFNPITKLSHGSVLDAKLSGLSMLRLDYTARPVESLSFTLASSYFVLSDLGTYTGYPIGKDGYFLGNEFSGELIWSPVSDLRLGIGGGIFLPSLGNADSKSDPMWRIGLSAVLVFF